MMSSDFNDDFIKIVFHHKSNEPHIVPIKDYWNEDG